MKVVEKNVSLQHGDHSHDHEDAVEQYEIIKKVKVNKLFTPS